MQPRCSKCGSIHLVKNGKVFGTQRFKCQSCGYQFTKNGPAGKPLALKIIAHSLYLADLPLRNIAQIIGVTAQSVYRWIKKWHPTYMSEIGDKTRVVKLKGTQVTDHLDIKPDENILIFSTILPSGAKFNTIIQLPQNWEADEISSAKNH